MNYITDIIPKNTPYGRRPGYSIKIEYVTAHNTGNPSSVATGERAWLTNPTNTREASFHIAIDQNNAIECIPTGLKGIFPGTSACENAWHAGDGRGAGNMKSIGIEICESGDYNKTMENAVILFARILYETGLGIDRVKQHFDWSGKDCPRVIRRTGTWNRFLSDISSELNRMKNKVPNAEQPKNILMLEEWQKNMGIAAVKRLGELGIINNPETWYTELGKSTPNWLFFEINRRMYEKLMTEITTLKNINK